MVMFEGISRIRGVLIWRSWAGNTVEAPRSAQELRRAAEEDPFAELSSGRRVIHPGFEAADRDIRRAGSIAKALGLEGPTALAEARDKFAVLDAEPPVSLAERRASRGG